MGIGPMKPVGEILKNIGSNKKNMCHTNTKD
jgi:hypothetical protein